jgi:hypothetical protein
MHHSPCTLALLLPPARCAAPFTFLKSPAIVSLYAASAAV